MRWGASGTLPLPSLESFSKILPESQDQNLTSNVVFVPISLAPGYCVRLSIRFYGLGFRDGHALEAWRPVDGRSSNGGAALRNMRRGAPGTLPLPSEESPERISEILPGSQGHNLVFAVLFVPSFLDLPAVRISVLRFTLFGRSFGVYV